jgi:hypothetical protein
MRIRIFLRILLTIYILAFIFISGVVLACAWGIIDIIHPQYWLGMLYANIVVKIIASAIAALIIVLSLKFMFTGARERKIKTKTLRVSETGSIKISILALQDMVNRYVTEINEIRNYKTKILVTDKGINIEISMAVLPGTNIPELTATLQTGIKDNIETLSGIGVGNTDILITDTSLTGK